jgi:hypothetical protein
LKLKVVEVGITVERLGIRVRKENTALRDAIGQAQAALVADGTLPALIKQWLGTGATGPRESGAPCCAGMSVTPLKMWNLIPHPLDQEKLIQSGPTMAASSTPRRMRSARPVTA